MPGDGSFPIVLTADRTLFTDYGGFGGGGFLACLPARIIPKFILHHFLCPRIPSKNGRAVLAPYSLRRIEAVLIGNGFDEGEIIVAHPDDLGKVVGEKTKIIGVTTVDPKGYAPVSHTLCSLLGGGEPCTAIEFRRLLTSSIIRKHKRHIKIIVGGPGAWQISDEEAKLLGIDVIFIGEGEEALAEIFRRVLRGENMPSRVYGEPIKSELIPRIINPARGGHVEITRGCGRGCQFCTQTARRWITFPLDHVIEEVKVNVRGGVNSICLLSDDGLRYGSKDLSINQEAVLKLYKSILALEGVESISISHISFSTVLQTPNLIRSISEICGYTEKTPLFGPQIGLETGSPRLIRKYMIGKPKPFTPEDWPEVVTQATHVLNENNWYPCTTLIIGLPGENEDDVIKTLEIVDDLKGSKQWLFPLFFSAMSPSKLEKEKAFTIDDMTNAHWELLFKCYEHSMKYTKEIIDKFIDSGGLFSKKGIIKALLKAGLRIVEKSFDIIKRNPREIINSIGSLDIRSSWSLLKLMPSLLKAII
ncbi:MAG: radical SAM protein [Candidatus Bathyarchaeia archaeon]|nr:B12-binding domain-containing radical SAM protein [Candidatus Bathyarchaeota archaeon]